MSITGVVTYDPRAAPRRQRIAVRLVVPLAKLLAARPPAQLRRLMGVLAKGTRPADAQLTTRARAAVVAVSLTCAGPQGCLPRSIATALYCRLRGRWPTWYVGVRRYPPFGAHAWVEAEGHPIGEPHPPSYHATLFSVG
ncbi:lasso peptide biosynthesis B2 protein [Kribbella sp. NPDC004875]|uniref:lasso peptide biosynthesis B2 protein n=1 Tax=Kribbella sp. NPDC004875 TaxID=3364107 RepID=UPI0036933E96